MLQQQLVNVLLHEAAWTSIKSLGELSDKRSLQQVLAPALAQ